MGCSCNKGRKQFEVVTDGGSGKVVFTSASKPTADTVAKRNPGSMVREKGADVPAATVPASTAG